MFRRALPYGLGAAAAILALVLVFSPAAASVIAQGVGDELLDNVPEPADAVYQSQNAIQEGGRHFYYTSTQSPADLVGAYQAALEETGWTIVDSGGGGDPFGFASGAGLTASDGTRYLKFNAGGPAGATHIDACVWPGKPQDDNCDQGQNQPTTGNATLGSAGALMDGVPELTGAEFQAEDAIQEGGRHFFFFSSTNTPANIVGAYRSALQDAGWEILTSGGGGDPFGYASGANLTASDGARYLKLHAGGQTGSIYVDGCIWPARPEDDNCGQNQNQNSGNALFGSSGDLLADLPEPADAQFRFEDAIRENGRHFYYTSDKAPSDIVNDYASALVANGWSIRSSGGGGDPFGMYGSGAGLTATNGTRYFKLNAGGQTGSTAHIDACIWPAQPSDDDCDEDTWREATGKAELGTVGSVQDDVPAPADAEFQAEDRIQEGGLHAFYTSTKSPADVVSAYEAALKNAGWTIESSGGGGDPFGMFGGAGLTATNGTRYLKFNAGGPAGKTFIDGCVWPTKPGDDNCGQNNNQNASLGTGEALLSGVPEVANATFQAEDAIQEGGRHFYYTSAGEPGDIVSDYGKALEAAGWEIVSSGGGGDPFGLFASGAGLTATDGTRYLKLGAGGPKGQVHIDSCVWPTKPSDDDCGQPDDNQTRSGDPVMGSSGDLLDGVPELTGAQFKGEDAIQEGGRHYFFTSSAAPATIVGSYQAALEDAGWTILDSGGGGDPFGLFASGAGLTATDGTRYLKLNAGGPAGSTFIDGCVWPAKPADDNCGQNNNN
jgi:hypothetical protein